MTMYQAAGCMLSCRARQHQAVYTMIYCLQQAAY
jgi:hypothetical protein